MLTILLIIWLCRLTKKIVVGKARQESVEPVVEVEIERNHSLVVETEKILHKAMKSKILLVLI